jgi:hypothetical protein
MPGIKNVTEVRKIEESHDTQSPYNRQQSKSHLQVAKSAAKRLLQSAEWSSAG